MGTQLENSSASWADTSQPCSLSSPCQSQACTSRRAPAGHGPPLSPLPRNLLGAARPGATGARGAATATGGELLMPPGLPPVSCTGPRSGRRVGGRKFARAWGRGRNVCRRRGDGPAGGRRAVAGGKASDSAKKCSEAGEGKEYVRVDIRQDQVFSRQARERDAFGNRNPYLSAVRGRA